MRHAYDDSLPFCNADDCVACQIVELQRWGSGPLTAAQRRGEPEDDEYYDEIPGDPTDRAAWYSRRDARLAVEETAAADRQLEARLDLVRAMQSTFRHDHPLTLEAS